MFPAVALCAKRNPARHIYSALPGTVTEQQARIAQIDEIRAGVGNDIIDMTSQQFDYIGDGVKISGGLGDDTIWANNGSNTLFGDAGLTKFVIIILSLAAGSAIGALIDIDKWVNRLGSALEKKFVKRDEEGSGGSFAEGFISCTIMTCVGAMAVYGSILDAAGQPSTLIAKSVIDAIACFVMAASLGIGCALSAVPMLIYQGIITALTLVMQNALAGTAVFDACIYYLSSVGNLILVIIGLNFLGATNVKTANMTPAVFIPFILVPILNLF
jgi:uncharacterized membrane protein YqgA involved in biofilm formation